MRAEQNPCLFPIDQPSNLSRSRSWWERFKRSRRARDLYWLWLPAVVFFAIGIVGDFYSWWERWGYLGNIVAGVTGALFGIPIAATVVQWLVRKESEWSSKRDTVTMAWRTLGSIHRSMLLIDADRAMTARHLITDAEQGFQRIRSSANAGDFPSQHELREVIEDYRAALRGVAELRATTHMLAESESVRNRYRFLNDAVLPQAESLDMVIISDELRGRLGLTTGFAYPGRLMTEEDQNNPLRNENLDSLIESAFASTAEVRQAARELIRTYVGYASTDLSMTGQTLESIDFAWRVVKEAYEHIDNLKRQFES